MTSENQTSSRRRRVTYSQLEVMWEFLNSRKDLAMGYNKSAQAREYSKRMWEVATASLNSQGQGAVKSPKEWANYWVDYKSKLKKRVAAVRSSQNRTGGGPADVPPLSEIEKKFLTILGEDYGTGLPDIQVDPLAPRVTSPLTAVENVVIDLYDEQEQPLIITEDDAQLPQEVIPQDVTSPLVVQEPQAASTSRRSTTSRQRRRRETPMTKETARCALVDISKQRLELEKQNHNVLQQMLNALNKIADKVDRVTGGRETSNEGTSSS